ncbi:MAG: hypothetical protein ABIJ34_04785 [archaeon]
MKKLNLLGKLILLTLFVMLINSVAASVIYDSIDSPMPGSYPSLGYEATSTYEFGDHISFAGTDRLLETVKVTMTNWACENDFTWETDHWAANRDGYNGEACLTTPGTGFNHPITLNIYEVDMSSGFPEPGALIATKTQTFYIKYRPSWDSVQCTVTGETPATDLPFGGKWYDPILGACVHGHNQVIEFDMTGLSTLLPDNVIFGVAYDTANYGANAIGSPGPYSSLNVGVGPNLPSVGTNPESDTAYLDSTWSGAYCDNGAGGTGTFRRDAGCWLGYLPAVQFSAGHEAVCGDELIEGDEECEFDSDCGVCQVCNSCACEYPVPETFVGNSGPTGTGGDTVVGVGIGVGIDVSNFCPEILQEHGECNGRESDDGSVCYFVDTSTDVPDLCDDEACLDDFANALLARGIVGRSYAFEGEEVHFDLKVLDKDGIVDDCVHAYVTLDNGYDPVEAGCTLVKTEDYVDMHTCAMYPDAIGYFECTYTVEPTEGGTVGEYWISVKAQDGCGQGCFDDAAGMISLFLNPEVALKLSSQDQFGFTYDIGGTVLTQGPYAGDTVYTPYFTVENLADPASGLYILLQLYGTDMWDYGNSAAMCPTSNVLDIKQVEYRASHLNVQQPWTTMPENYAGKDFVFRGSNFGGNFLGVGDDVTMRLRLNIPSPCRGNFNDGGEIVFVGHVI